MAGSDHPPLSTRHLMFARPLSRACAKPARRALHSSARPGAAAAASVSSGQQQQQQQSARSLLTGTGSSTSKLARPTAPGVAFLNSRRHASSSEGSSDGTQQASSSARISSIDHFADISVSPRDLDNALRICR